MSNVQNQQDFLWTSTGLIRHSIGLAISPSKGLTQRAWIYLNSVLNQENWICLKPGNKMCSCLNRYSVI